LLFFKALLRGYSGNLRYNPAANYSSNLKVFKSFVTSFPDSRDFTLPNNKMRLKDKSALITGAGSGIGRSIAQAFAREGARVAIADVDFATATQAASEIKSDGGIAISIGMDVTDEKQVDTGVEAVCDSFEGLDILVSNAGIQIISSIVDFSYADWRKLLAVHLDGAFLTTRATMRAMISRGRGGCILYLGSIHSHIASPNKSAYVAAKHAIVGLTKAVAKEGAKAGIRSNVICPGFVRTPLVEKQIPQQARQLGITEEEVVKGVMLRETVDGEFTSLEDVASTAVFLAAFPTNALTGQSIVVSHGHFMQ
jgi:3-hydroxybutyrate dehydrogenase